MDRESTYQELQKKLRNLERENARLLETVHEIEVSEKLHRLTLENITDTVLVTDDEGNIIYACPNTGYIFGLSQQKVYESGTIQRLMNGAVCDISELKSKGEIAGIERTVKHASGDERFVLINARSVNINGGTALYIMRDITEQKLAVGELLESEKRLRSILETVNDGIILQAASGEILTWNKGTEEIFGIPAKDAIGQTSEEKEWRTICEDGSTYEGKDHPSMITLRTGEPRSNELMGAYKSSGELRWISINTNPLFQNDEKEPYAVVISFSDVTELKNALDELKSNSEQFRLIAENSIDFIWQLNSQGNFTYASPALKRIFGYTTQEALNMSFRDFFPEIEHPKAEKVFNEAVSGVPSQLRDFTALRKDGLPIRIEVSVSPIRKGGEIIGVQGIARDITERMRAEEALRESEERFRAAFMGSPIAIVISTQEDGVWVDVNQAFLDMFGYTRDEVIGKSALSANLWFDPNDRKKIITALDQGEEVKNQEVSLRRKDGSLIIAVLSVRPLILKGKKHLLFITEDITDKYKAEENYQMLFREMIDGFALHEIICDDNGHPVNYRFLAVNPAFERLTGLRRESLIRKTVLEIMPNTEPYWIEKYGQVALTGKPDHFENYAQEIGRYFQVTAFSPAENRFACIFTDITERKRMEEALRESEERYRNLVELSPDAVFVQQKDKFAYINPACMKILRVNNPEELIGKSIYDFIHPDWREIVGSRVDRLYQEKKVLPRAEQKYVTADKETIDVEAAAAYIHYSGKPGVLCVIKDITDRKKAEMALRESEEIVRKKLEAILLPEVDIEVLGLADIVDVQAIQEMMDHMYSLTDIGVAVLDLQGKVLVSIGWQDICTKFHRVHPSTSKNCIESDVELSSGVKPGEFKLYKCKNNMWDIATPIVIGETHVGNLFLGQFFFDDEVPDRDFFLSQAVKYGFDEEAYLDALDRAPRWSRDTVNHVMNFYARFSNLISTLSYSNLKLARTLNEHQRSEEALKQSESRFKGFFENSGAYCYMVSPEGTIIEVNASALLTLGYAKEELIGRPVSTIYSEESLAKSKELFEELNRTGKIENAELMIQCKNGEKRTVLLNVNFVHDEKGNFLHSTSMQFDITEWRKLEERFRVMYEKSPIGVAIADMSNQKIIQANVRFCEILGYGEDELKGLTIPDITHPEDWEKELNLIRSYDKEKIDDYIFEKRYIRKDGSICWVKVVGDMLEFSDLNRQVAIACVEDITESKKALDALRESEEKYRSLVDNLTLGVTLLSPEMEALAINDQFAKWYPEIETTQKPLCYHVFNDPPREAPCSYCPVVKTLSDGQVHESITETPMGDTVKHFRIVSSPIKNEDGTIRHIIEMVEDLTEQYKKDRQLFEYKKAVESSKDVIAAVSADYRYLFVNEAFLIINRLSRREVEGETVEKILGKQAFLNQIKPQLDRCFLGESVSFEMDLEHPELGTRFLQVSYFPLKDEHEAITGAVGIIRDVSEIKRWEEENKRLEEHLRQAQKMEAIGVLAGGIAHDFNNILWGIIGFTEMSLVEAPEDSTLEENLNHVLSAGHRAKELVQQILAFSRMSEQEKRPIDLRLIVNEALKLLRASIPTTIEISQKIAKKDTAVLADPTQIHQVIMNLCTNASHAMEPGGGELNVIVGPVDFDTPRILASGEISEGAYVKLSVGDTGSGMDSTMLERIFEPYYTTKEKGVGTGLGLSVVHGIVQSHGGVIDVFSEPGRGSVFDVYFPRIEKDILSEKKSDIPMSKGNEKVLFVDDEEVLVSLVRRMLEHLGYDVTTRTNSMEALDLFRSQHDRFDLVMTDLTMPYMTGDVLVQELLKIRPDIPVVLCTGFSEKISEERAREIGVRAFVLKPIVLKDFSKTIRKVIDE